MQKSKFPFQAQFSSFFITGHTDLTFECIFSYFQEISRLPVISILS